MSEDIQWKMINRESKDMPVDWYVFMGQHLGCPFIGTWESGVNHKVPYTHYVTFSEIARAIPLPE